MLTVFTFGTNNRCPLLNFHSVFKNSKAISPLLCMLYCGNWKLVMWIILFPSFPVFLIPTPDPPQIPTKYIK